MGRKKTGTEWGGPPEGIVLYATPEGWRHSITTGNGGFLCGRLASLPADADDAEAQAAASAMLVSLAREFHGVDLTVVWLPGSSPHTWIGDARPVAAE